jgi:hypothetical protein
MAGRLARVQQPVPEAVGVRKHRIGLGRMAHIFLYAEIGHREAEMQCRAHADRRKIRRAVAAGANAVEIGEARNAAQMRDPAGVHDRCANVINELLLNQRLGVPDRIEDFAHREWSGRMLANQPERGRVLCGRRVLQPEWPVGFQIFSEAGGLNRRQPGRGCLTLH